MFPLNFFGLLDISFRNSILLTVFLAGVIYYNFKRWKIYVLASKLEGPNSFPIIGCAYHFYGLDTSGNDCDSSLYVSVCESYNCKGYCKLLNFPSIRKISQDTYSKYTFKNLFMSIRTQNFIDLRNGSNDFDHIWYIIYEWVVT